MASISTTPTGAAAGVMRHAWLIASIVPFALLAMWTWKSCPDPVVDFGREVYVPWRLAQGEQLYRDIAHFNGPFSQYFNSVAMRVGGASLMTIKVANLLTSAGTLAIILLLAKTLADEVCALLCAMCFCIFFAFNQTAQNANFNWLTPYSHELTHGVAFSLAMIVSLCRAIRTRHLRWSFFAGMLLGFVMLTKAEVMLASGVGAGVMLLTGRATRKLISGFVAGAIATTLAALILLLCAMPFDVAWKGIAGSWLFLGNDRLMKMSYFAWLNGTNDIAGNLKTMILWLAIYCLPIGMAIWLARRVHKKFIWIASSIAVVVGFEIVYQLFLNRVITTNDFLRPLPVVLVGWAVHETWRRRGDPQHALIAGLLCFSVLLLLKILLRTQATHYGFALAMPGMITAIILLDRRLREQSARRWIARAMLLGLLAAPMWNYLRLDRVMIQRRSFSLGEGANQFSTDTQRGAPLKDALESLEKLIRPGDTVAAMPEGLMVNFLLRAKSPTRDFFWIPPAIAMFGEERMLASLKTHPPDWIVLIHADQSLYDARWFGKDYAREISFWINRDYQVVQTSGAVPFTSGEFGVQLLHRKEAP
jgi:hypothetical protein